MNSLTSKTAGVLAVLLVALTALPFTGVRSAMASPGADVLIYGGLGPQNEVSIAVNPLNADNIVVGFNDHTEEVAAAWGGVARWQVSYAYSVDGGKSWTYGHPLVTPNQAGACDPWLDFDSHGYLYYTAITSQYQVFVSVAAPDGNGMVGPLGFGTPQIVDDGNSGFDHLTDKPVIAVDKTGGANDGNIYVVWARTLVPLSAATGFRIFLRRGTRTAGTTTITWDQAQQVGPDTFTQGPQVAVGPKGDVYVGYQRQTSAKVTTADAQFVSSSKDGGRTFDRSSLVSSVTAPDWDVTPRNRWARKSSFASLGVSPRTGTVFMAWTDDRNGDSDVLLSRSTDGGLTWLAVPRRVNTDALRNGKDQWAPALTVDSEGTLYVIFYDRRNDPRNVLTWLYVARSTDDGDTFTDAPVSASATNPNAFQDWESGCLGDYVGIDSVGAWTYASWGDGRNGNPGPTRDYEGPEGEGLQARPGPGPRDYNSDVYFKKWWNTLETFKLTMVFITSTLLISHIHAPHPTMSTPDADTSRVEMMVLPIEGFSGTVDLSAEGVPKGAYYSFAPSSGVPPFNSTFTITRGSAEEGTYEVKIQASFDGEVLTSPIKYVVTLKPYIILGAMYANSGDTMTLEGDGFTPDSPFDIFFDGGLVKSGQADAEGMISAEISIPSDAPDGIHTVLVKDKGGVEASASLTTPMTELEGEEEKPFPHPTLATSLAITFDPAAVDIGTTPPGVAVVTVTITPTLQDRLVTVYYSKGSPTGPFTVIGSGPTGPTGQFVVASWTPPETGTYYFIAVFDGDTSYASSRAESNPMFLTAVPEFPSWITPIILVATLTSLMIVLRKHNSMPRKH